jgi:phosphate transport system permease protein
MSRKIEWIVEKCFIAVGLSSVAFIFLIFIFVFKEAYLLVGHIRDHQKKEAEKVQEPLRSEVKKDRAPVLTVPKIDPATKTNASPVADVLPEYLKPHVYNPEVFIVDIKIPALDADEPRLQKPESFVYNFFGTAWQPVSKVPRFGILPLLFGTLKTTFVAIALGAPMGVLSAIFVAFFVSPRWRNIIKPVLELLSAFPSVVIGFFCLTMVGSLMQNIFGVEFRLNAIVGGIGLAIAIVPVIFTIAEDALSAVPKSLLEASVALGGTVWQAAYRVMLPAALPGVFAAVLLGIGRAFGETMIALMATGNAAYFSLGLTDPTRTFAATIGAEMGEVIWGSEHYSILFVLGIILFLFSVSISALSEFVVKRKFARNFGG